MTAKYRAQYRKQKRAEEAAKISRVDEEALELMRKLRTHTYGAELGDGPRAVAARALMTAIDGMAEVITGDREHFFAKAHSLAQGYPPLPGRRE